MIYKPAQISTVFILLIMAPDQKYTKRVYLRFKIPKKKVTYMAGGQLGKAELVNISAGGCSVNNSTTNLEKDDPVLIVIEMVDCAAPLELKARVTRAKPGQFSTEFTEIDDTFRTTLTRLLVKESRNMPRQ